MNVTSMNSNSVGQSGIHIFFTPKTVAALINIIAFVSISRVSHQDDTVIK